MSYVDEGAPSAKPVLMVHGNPTWGYLYRRAIAALRGDHRCVVPDHVGMGRSDKPQHYPYTLGTHVENLLSLVRTLDLRDVTLVVHDWGGPIGLSAAVREPERFSRLVISNTSAFRSDLMPWQIGLGRSPLGAPLLKGLNLFVRGVLVDGLTDPSRLTARERVGYLAPYDSWANRVAVHRFVRDIPTRPSDPGWGDLLFLEQNLHRLADLPTLLLWGTRDWCFGPPYLAEFKRRMPHAGVAALRAGHLVMDDAPAEYTSALAGFVRR